MKKPDNQRISFTHRLGSFASATFLSRILGYIRDALVASYFGGGAQTDAFYAAFKIPNLFRRFLGEGSLTAAFVPVFTETLNNKGKEEAKNLLNAIFSGLLVILVIIVFFGVLFAPQVTQLVSWGFTRDPEKFQLATELTRLIFPFLMIISIAALVTAVLNSCSRFFIPALAPSGLSIGEIAFILILASRFDSPIHGLAISAVVGVGIHLVWQLPALFREGYSLRWVKPFVHPQVKTLFLLMLPSVVGLCADQVNSFVDQLCASFLRDGSVTALYNSNRVMQLPLALFGVAVASVSLPALSKAASLNDMPEFKQHLNFALRIANFVLIPSFLGLAVLGYPIIQTLFERGQFLPENSWMTYTALVPYSFGLPAFSAIKILASAFYAQKDTRTPVRIALWAMLINVILNLLLMKRFEVAGLSAATSISAWFQCIALFLLLRKKVGIIGGRKIFKSFIFGALAGLLMSGVCVGLYVYVFETFPIIVRTVLSISMGVLIYFYSAKLLKVPEQQFFIDALMKRKMKD